MAIKRADDSNWAASFLFMSCGVSLKIRDIFPRVHSNLLSVFVASLTEPLPKGMELGHWPRLTI